MLAEIAMKKRDFQQAEQMYLRIVGMKKPESQMGLRDRFQSFSALALLTVLRNTSDQAERYYQEAETTLEEMIPKGLTKGMVAEGLSFMKRYAHFLRRSGFQRNIERETRLLLQLGRMGQKLPE